MLRGEQAHHGVRAHMRQQLLSLGERVVMVFFRFGVLGLVNGGFQRGVLIVNGFGDLSREETRQNLGDDPSFAQPCRRGDRRHSGGGRQFACHVKTACERRGFAALLRRHDVRVRKK